MTLKTPAALHRAPRALLLDFGGVIVRTARRTQGRAEFAADLSQRLAATGVKVSAERIEACLTAGATALKHWKHAASRRREPRELDVTEILGDFYFGDLPDPARAVLTGWGAELLDEMSTALTDHLLREGAAELIDYARTAGIALGIVSNAHAGRAHRRILAELGLDAAFGVQIYSDEAGIRKPHPQMLQRASTALGVELAECWYVGDTLDRDLVAGRRAGVGAVVLTRSQHTDEPPFLVDSAPEAVVETPAQLLTILRDAVDHAPVEAEPGTTDDAEAASPQLTRHPGGTLDSPALLQHTHRAILLDHGGVVSATTAPQQPFAEAAEAVEAVLARAGCPVAPGAGLRIIRGAHQQYKVHKKRQDELELFGEITAGQYWGEFTAAEVTEQQRQALRAEAGRLQLALYRSKSVKTERPGIRQLLEYCTQTSRRVVIVSNTICGLGVRSIIRGYGLEEHIHAWVCSDEFGWKKPHRSIFDYALRAAGVAAEHAVMVGDKPYNDAYGAQGVGVARRIITRGGSGEEDEITQGLKTGWVTDVVDHPGQIPALLS
ncbi:HAD family hydrolase [Nesterenkonia alba]|uniref:HAD family hydrolase n=1 Tax=Nesterenkonia alba TaxID=515814 RepID=UPI0003B670A9|nr:HAD family hydrolase [Nesterenkonia alba]